MIDEKVHSYGSIGGHAPGLGPIHVADVPWTWRCFIASPAWRIRYARK